MPSRKNNRSHKEFKTLHKGVTAPQGFLSSGMACEIKYLNRPDLCLIFSKVPAAAAGLFTRNRTVAAPVVWTRKILHTPYLRAIIANSGNANACTGDAGWAHTVQMAEHTANALSLEKEDVAVASTGVIGMPLPIERILPAIPELASRLSRSGDEDAAQAIMTTDTYPKFTALEWMVRKNKIRIGGIAKGSGMIHPDMATMLSFVTTDAAVDPGTLQTALKHAVDNSFHRITVDGDTSTNDMVVIMANGLSNVRIRKKDLHTSGFQEALDKVCLHLAQSIVKDGEGATKFVTIRIMHGRSKAGCLVLAKKIACSNLVKTALYGEDANWGRILSAAGASGIPIRPEKTDIYFDDIPIVKQGVGLGEKQEKRASRILKKNHFDITIDLHLGSTSAEVYTSDLSIDYVKINADYRT